MLVSPAPKLELTTDRKLARLRGAAAVVLQRHSRRERHPEIENTVGFVAARRAAALEPTN